MNKQLRNMPKLNADGPSAPVKSFSPDADHIRALRDAFGRFATGVTVITTQTPQGPLGMTANSFSSISLDPALVLWSPAVSSKRYAAFAQAETFCIHILAEHQSAVATHFAQRGDGFDRFDWMTGPTGAPALRHSLAEFHCQTYAVHPAGDHALILGEVKQVRLSECDRSGLLFERSAFARSTPLPDQ